MRRSGNHLFTAIIEEVGKQSANALALPRISAFGSREVKARVPNRPYRKASHGDEKKAFSTQKDFAGDLTLGK